MPRVSKELKELHYFIAPCCCTAVDPLIEKRMGVHECFAE